jgi:hypothetical protein
MDTVKVFRRMTQVYFYYSQYTNFDKFVWKIPQVIFDEMIESMAFAGNFSISDLTFMGIPVEIVSAIETDEILFAIKIATEVT